jgi:hypothetical protein
MEPALAPKKNTTNALLAVAVIAGILILVLITLSNRAPQQSNNSGNVQGTPTITPSVKSETDLINVFGEAVNSKNYQVILPLISDQTTLSFYATDCCEVHKKQDLIDNLSAEISTFKQFIFDQNSSALAQLRLTISTNPQNYPELDGYDLAINEETTMIIAFKFKDQLITDIILISIQPEIIPALVDLKIDNGDGPVTAYEGNTSTLIWYSLNLDETTCKLKYSTITSGQPGAPTGMALGKTQTLSNATTGSYQYSISCLDNQQQPVTDQVELDVLPNNARVDLKINGKDTTVKVKKNTDYTLTWSTNNIDESTCSVSYYLDTGQNNPTLIQLPVTKTQTLNQSVAGNYTYYLRCLSSAGTAISDDISVQVN